MELYKAINLIKMKNRMQPEQRAHGVLQAIQIIRWTHIPMQIYNREWNGNKWINKA